MKRSVEVTWDTVRNLIISSLQEDYHMLQDSGDPEDQITVSGVLTVLRYYMSDSDYQNWLDEIGER